MTRGLYSYDESSQAACCTKKPEFEPQPEILNTARPSSQYCNCTNCVKKLNKKSIKKNLAKKEVCH